MPPKTKMTPEQVAQDIEDRKANVREYKDPHAVKHKGVNKTIENITPKPEFKQPWEGDTSMADPLTELIKPFFGDEHENA